MTWTNAFDLGACTVEVFRVTAPDAPDYSAVLAKGAGADLTISSWDMHIAVSADGVVTLSNVGGLGIEADLGARVVPVYSLTDMLGARAVLPISVSGAGDATADGSTLAGFTTGEASINLTAQSPYDRISAQTNTIGSSSGTPVVQFTPEFSLRPVAGDEAIVVETGSYDGIVTVSVADDGTPVTPDSVNVDTQPDNGTAESDGITFLYTPNPGYEGLDSFTYTADVGDATSSVGTVSIKVVPTHNCDCSDTSGNKTLKQLRDDLARRLGYGAQVDNLPPGMTELLNSFLTEAQELLYRRYDVLRTERFYSWFLQEGVRMYDIDDNDESCTKRIDPRKVTWAGVEHMGIWYPLICGIPPELYSNNITGWRPSHYEIRQCIEVWPKPAATEGSLIIKGDFGLEAFAADTDKTTIDDRLVFLLALANAKAHYGKPDANNYVQQLETMLLGMVAGSHQTRKYIPGRDGRTDYVYTMPVPTVPFA